MPSSEQRPRAVRAPNCPLVTRADPHRQAYTVARLTTVGTGLDRCGSSASKDLEAPPTAGNSSAMSACPPIAAQSMLYLQRVVNGGGGQVARCLGSKELPKSR